MYVLYIHSSKTKFGVSLPPSNQTRPNSLLQLYINSSKQLSRVTGSLLSIHTTSRQDLERVHDAPRVQHFLDFSHHAQDSLRPLQG